MVTIFHNQIHERFQKPSFTTYHQACTVCFDKHYTYASKLSFKFKSAIYSWSSRSITTLQERVEVVKIFALTRTYYVASILPISKTMVKKFESIIGNFIWKTSGWLLRVSLDEIKNTCQNGGL